HIPSGFSLWQDTGYQGYRPEGVRIYQPVKKPKGRELTKEQKLFNRDIAVDRVRVEHAIGSAKRYRIVKDECRLRKNLFVNHVFQTCAALHNFRIAHKPFNYKFKLT
ncbi:MAG: transposase family protein, partial [Prevotella sp.]|nr:transposase family protein [Prevotella sp.]